MLTNWVPQSALRSWKNRFTAMTQIGESVTCTGKIVEKFEKDQCCKEKIQQGLDDVCMGMQIMHREMGKNFVINVELPGEEE